VIVNSKDFITEAITQPSKEEYYKKVEKDLTLDHEQLINQLIDKMISNGDWLSFEASRLKKTYILRASKDPG